MGFLGVVRDDPEGIISIVEMLKDNLDRGYAPIPQPEQVSFRETVNVMIEKILSHKDKVETSGQLIINLYDDLLDELMNAGLGEFM